MIKWPARNRKERRHPGPFMEDRGVQVRPIYLGINLYKRFKKDNPEDTGPTVQEYKQKKWQTYNKEVKDESTPVHISQQGTENVNRKGSSSSSSLRGAQLEAEREGKSGTIVSLGQETNKDNSGSKRRKPSKDS